MTGKNIGLGTPGSLSLLFHKQANFQGMVTSDYVLPRDDVRWFQYHMAAMQEELGEVLKADKRWKTHRNTNYDPANKLEELADVFVTAINLSLFSGFSAEVIYNAIVSKIDGNEKKLLEGFK